jgi:hypothetical protein
VRTLRRIDAIERNGDTAAISDPYEAAKLQGNILSDRSPLGQGSRKIWGYNPLGYFDESGREIDPPDDLSDEDDPRIAGRARSGGGAKLRLAEVLDVIGYRGSRANPSAMARELGIEYPNARRLFEADSTAGGLTRRQILALLEKIGPSDEELGAMLENLGISPEEWADRRRERR